MDTRPILTQQRTHARRGMAPIPADVSRYRPRTVRGGRRFSDKADPLLLSFRSKRSAAEGSRTRKAIASGSLQDDMEGVALNELAQLPRSAGAANMRCSPQQTSRVMLKLNTVC